MINGISTIIRRLLLIAEQYQQSAGGQLSYGPQLL